MTRAAVALAIAVVALGLVVGCSYVIGVSDDVVEVDRPDGDAGDAGDGPG